MTILGDNTNMQPQSQVIMRFSGNHIDDLQFFDQNNVLVFHCIKLKESKNKKGARFL